MSDDGGLAWLFIFIIMMLWLAEIYKVLATKVCILLTAVFAVLYYALYFIGATL